MFIWTKSSAHRVYPNARPMQDDCGLMTLQCGKNMRVSGQVLLRDYHDFTITGMDITGIPAAWCSFYRQECITYNDGMPYPDKLSENLAGVVKAYYTQSLWTVIRVPADADTGRLRGEIITHTAEHGDIRVPVILEIFPVTLPEPKDGTYAHEYFFHYNDMSLVHPGTEMFSEDWWKVMTAYAEAMKALRINHLDVTMRGLLAGEGTYRTGEKTWQFNFDRVDAFLEHYLTHGSFTKIVLGAPTAALTADGCWAVDEKGEDTWFRTRSEEGEAWLRAYFAAIREHFTEKGWYDMTLTHLSDEPHESENWLWLRQLLAEECPGMPVSEPMDTYEPTLDMAEACDEFIPRLEVYEQGKDYYDKRVKAGKRLWCYSCCFPEDPWYLNKFIDLPHHYARLIHWACYANGITGFLHWGFNYWGGEMYGLAPMARFKGDGFIVYPDAEKHGVTFSNRALATWEGIEEYELMRILEKKHPGAVRAIAAGLAKSFHEFDPDPAALEEARRKLLALTY